MNHLELIEKTTSLIAAGDIVGAESALAELADEEGDGALMVVLDAHRDIVARHFAAIFAGAARAGDDPLDALLRAGEDEGAGGHRHTGGRAAEVSGKTPGLVAARESRGCARRLRAMPPAPAPECV